VFVGIHCRPVLRAAIGIGDPGERAVGAELSRDREWLPIERGVVDATDAPELVVAVLECELVGPDERLLLFSHCPCGPSVLAVSMSDRVIFVPSPP
jgi:hypothetical protein